MRSGRVRVIKVEKVLNKQVIKGKLRKGENTTWLATAPIII